MKLTFPPITASASAMLMLLLASPPGLRPAAAEERVLEWEVLDGVKIPSSLSDNSSTHVPSLGRILLAGGCDAPNGNTFVDATGFVLDFFICESISSKLYSFDPEAGTFETLADLPRPRYRHAAVEAGGKLWLVGGRTVPEDSVIAEIDVYDLATGAWSTPVSVPDGLLTSDNAAFASPDGASVYVVGGYNPFYSDPDSLPTTFSFNVKRALRGKMEVTTRAGLGTGRGDIHAVTSADGTKAYVTGGFQGMCQPLQSVEVYDIENDSWEYSGSLNSARADKALVQLNDHIYAVGGETSHPQQCSEDPSLIPPLSAQSIAVDDVEVLRPGKRKWQVLADLPSFRFRFSAAAWPDTGTIYAFGGQTAFDADCNCFPTSNEVVVLKVGSRGLDGSSSPSARAGAGIALAVAGLSGALWTTLM